LEAEEEGIPFKVARMALEGEFDDGWTPMSRRRQKTEAETVADF
jgi:hypothetical protein